MGGRLAQCSGRDGVVRNLSMVAAKAALKTRHDRTRPPALGQTLALLVGSGQGTTGATRPARPIPDLISRAFVREAHPWPVLPLFPLAVALIRHLASGELLCVSCCQAGHCW